MAVGSYVALDLGQICGAVCPDALAAPLPYVLDLECLCLPCSDDLLPDVLDPECLSFIDDMVCA